ncbi:MAG: GyrI-like domain-containing protein [Cyclobacteriaceae bacterium]
MKKLVWALAIGVVLILAWYLFLRPFEYKVKFKAKTLPGDVIETIRMWDRTLENSKILEVDSTYALKQELTLNEHVYTYDWKYEVVNDTTTNVSIEISEPKRSIINKILIPFTEQPIEKDARDISYQFVEILRSHLDITEVKIEGESETLAKFCACTTLDTRQTDKANGMMRDYKLLAAFVGDFSLELDGPPIVEVTNWNHNEGKLTYDFCFPIVKNDTLPGVREIKFKELKSRKALKAIYHGNYITSDRAWYALVHYAATNGYKIDGAPIEYFYNNPNMGSNEMEWTAEIFLPVK